MFLRKKINRIIGCLILVLLAPSCSTINTRFDYNPEINFSRYQKYSWQVPQEEKSEQSPAENLIDNAIDEALSAKGYQLVPKDQAHFIVGYQMIFQEKKRLRRYGYPHGYHYHRPGYPHHRYHRFYRRGSVYTYYYTKGTLILDVVDAQTQEVVWSGEAVRIVNPNKPIELGRKMKESVSRLLKKFPPAKTFTELDS